MARPRPTLQSLGDFLTARLSKRIAYWVFVSIVVIEGVILVPSVMRRERELLNYMRSLSTAQALGRLDEATLATLNDDKLIDYLQAIQTNQVILGGAIYDLDGTQVGGFGEMPQLTLAEGEQGRLSDRYFRHQQRYDAPWDMPPLRDRYILIVRHDARWVQREFFAFIGRIIGLVVIISVFVTGATLIVLRRLVIKPIMLLRQDLMTAGQAIGDDSDTQTLAFESWPYARADELGDVIATFRQMFEQITAAVATRKQSEMRFRTLVEQAADAFFVIDAVGQIIDINQNACDSLGYSRDQLLQLSVTDIQTTYNQADFEAFWQQLRPGVPQTLEGWHQRQDGSGFPVEVRLGLLVLADERYGLALARDISDRRASEAAQARLAEIGELATMIVHEVRNPLNTVLLGLNSFRSLELPERFQTRLDLALEESERLQKLLNGILMYSREPTLRVEPLEINGLIEHLATVIEHELGNRQPLLRVTTLPYPVVVSGDRDQLKQVFINLISNAQEADPTGVVTWVVQPPIAGQVTVSIHNGGASIAPELLPKLTQPFFTTKASGNGLGLAITKRIIDAHQGQLTIHSAAAGTEVMVTLPQVGTGSAT
ncbi:MULTISPECIES: ATP-binding protein [Cyanophyceae]|uniref:ATP-binding protein n=1 Tax=Cyanophyceae TaxID=3028117 RepID=UPI0016858959|nr:MULTISPECIES: ATP-binding protein [Cyanophyceae]MBD1916496.1 PAS domain S-box protein [Phormidium sp. FACHB-77]MBD2032063.1 PAS domain S-box protein [Phormidium sp. FACHB-322]MBD2052943.1 PAS domain S-box protein [Leptolyngbya sp. FACHB-60]